MKRTAYRGRYRRKRPHIQPPNSTLFVTTRLAGSIPQTILREHASKLEWFDWRLRQAKKGEDEEIKSQLAWYHRETFKYFEELLHKAETGPLWLGRPDIRGIVYDKLIEDDGKRYRLDAFSIMSNHLHVVFGPHLWRNVAGEVEGEENSLSAIMKSWKGATARKANLALGRTGSFWETEGFDHYIRDGDEFDRVVRYTLNNPVKAGLVRNWQDWPGNFLAERLRGRF